jgi:hypothetical protein
MQRKFLEAKADASVRAECHCGSVGASPSRVPRRDSPDHATLFSSSLT